MDFIDAIEKALGKKAKKHYLPIQEGDVPATQADVKDLEVWFGYRPMTAIQKGIGNFVDWYMTFYRRSSP
jgi:UDP-glucuronate 4-epimerase